MKARVLALLAGIPMLFYVIALALCVIGVQQWRVHHYRTRAETFQSAVDTFKSAQTTNLATIAKLQGANADWADKCKANQPEARHEAALSVQADAKRQAAAAANIKTLRSEAEHDVSVKAWLAQPVPDSVTRILRQ